MGIDFIHGDIRTREDLFSIEQKFDLFIEASAEPSVHAGNDGSPDYLIQTNLVGTINCLEFARKRCGSMIFLSTSRVYSIKDLMNIGLTTESNRFVVKEQPDIIGLTKKGITESFNVLGPRSLYGATKLSSEFLIQEYVHSFSQNIIINRCGVIAGPGQWGKVDQGVFTLWVANHFFKKDLKFTGFGGLGHQVRDLLHPVDLFSALESQWDKIPKYSGESFNIGGGMENSTSLKEYTSLCEEITGNNLNIKSHKETLPNDIPWYVTDSSKFEETFDWKPRHTVKDIAEDIHTWIKDNLDEVKKIFN